MAVIGPCSIWLARIADTVSELAAIGMVIKDMVSRVNFTPWRDIESSWVYYAKVSIRILTSFEVVDALRVGCDIFFVNLLVKRGKKL